MRRLLPALMLAMLLAGCSGSSGAGWVGNSSWEPRVPSPTFEHVWQTFGAGTVGIDATDAPRASLELPNGTQLVIVNLTLVEGVILSPRASLGGCAWTDEQTYVARGQQLQHGCDDPATGAQPLRIAHEGGAAKVQYLVGGVVALCHRSVACPADTES